MLRITSNIFRTKFLALLVILIVAFFKNLYVKNIYPCRIKLCLHANVQFHIIILNAYYFYLENYLEIYCGYNLLFRKTQETVK